MNRRILVTGCARSGTGYMAQLLTASGVPCGHEELFNPTSLAAGGRAWPESVGAESSWLAAPIARELAAGTLVVHVVRHPASVLRSLWRIGLFRTRSVYRSHAERHSPQLRHGTPVELTIAYWVHWNELAEAARDVPGLRYVRVRVEALEEASLRWLFELAERDLDPALARRALASVPRDANTAGDRSRDAYVDWSELIGHRLASRAEELAARYGFGQRALRALSLEVA